MKYDLIIAAAGNSVRFKKNKLNIKINNKYVIDKTIEIFLNLKIINKIIIVSKTTLKSKYFKHPKILNIIGGETRQLSINNGLSHVKTEYVFIHDGARPFFDSKYLKIMIEEIKNYDAIILCSKLNNTIKKIKPENKEVIQTENRDKYVNCLTPQLFNTKLLKNCMKKALLKDFTSAFDDSQLIEMYSNKPIKIILSDNKNLKITYPNDLKF